MTIEEFMKLYDARITIGGKWLCLDDDTGKWIIRGHDYGERGTHVVGQADTLPAALSGSLAAGTYYLAVEGIGKGDIAGSGG